MGRKRGESSSGVSAGGPEASCGGSAVNGGGCASETMDQPVSVMQLPPRTGGQDQIRRFHEQVLIYARTNDAASVQALLCAGCAANSTNSAGQSALHIGAMWGSLDAVTVLLEGQADPNLPNRMQGSSPLHSAAMGIGPPDKRADAARILLRYMADPRIVDRNGKPPLSVCNDEAVRSALLAPPQVMSEQQGQLSSFASSALPMAPPMAPPMVPPMAPPMPPPMAPSMVPSMVVQMTPAMPRQMVPPLAQPVLAGTSPLLPPAFTGAGQSMLPHSAALTEGHGSQLVEAYSVAVKSAAADPTLVAKWLASKASASETERAESLLPVTTPLPDYAPVMWSHPTAAEHSCAVVGPARPPATGAAGLTRETSGREAAGEFEVEGKRTEPSPEQGPSENESPVKDMDQEECSGDVLRLRLQELVKSAEARVAALEVPGPVELKDPEVPEVKGMMEKEAEEIRSIGTSVLVEEGLEKNTEGVQVKQVVSSKFDMAAFVEKSTEVVPAKTQISKPRQSFDTLRQAFPAMNSTPRRARPVSNLIVCIRPLPIAWGTTQLWERFGWYGHLVDATVEWRVSEDDDACSAGPLPPSAAPQPASVWALGVLRFDDEHTAKEVVQRERGGFENGATIEAGVARKALGWSDGPVLRYFKEHGVGLLETNHGHVHFEVPLEARSRSFDLEGATIQVHVEVGGDGLLHAKEMRLPEKFSAIRTGRCHSDSDPGRIGEDCGLRPVSGRGGRASSLPEGRKRCQSRSRPRKSRKSRSPGTRRRRRNGGAVRDRRRSNSETSASAPSGLTIARRSRSRAGRLEKRGSHFSSEPPSDSLRLATGRRLELHGAISLKAQGPAVDASLPVHISDGLGKNVDAGALDAARRLAAQRLQEVPGTGAVAPLRPGDWICHTCSGHNFASRAHCFRCHQPAPSNHFDPRIAAMRPGDWLCAACGNHNFAMRDTCKRCQEPKQPPGSFFGGRPLMRP